MTFDAIVEKSFEGRIVIKALMKIVDGDRIDDGRLGRFHREKIMFEFFAEFFESDQLVLAVDDERGVDRSRNSPGKQVDVFFLDRNLLAELYTPRLNDEDMGEGVTFGGESGVLFDFHEFEIGRESPDFVKVTEICEQGLQEFVLHVNFLQHGWLKDRSEGVGAQREETAPFGSDRVGHSRVTVQNPQLTEHGSRVALRNDALEEFACALVEELGIFPVDFLELRSGTDPSVFALIWQHNPDQSAGDDIEASRPIAAEKNRFVFFEGGDLKIFYDFVDHRRLAFFYKRTKKVVFCEKIEQNLRLVFP